MTNSQQRSELKAFLRARRAALSPEAAGLPRGIRRLTPGLRREEVARLADVGVTWYTWLEQGRAINVSAAALARIAGALSLTPTDEAYLFSLAGLPRPEVPVAGFELPMQTQGMLDLYQAPAFVLDPVFDVLAYNRMADRLYDFDAGTGPFARNHLWNAFLNPARQRLYPDFEEGALNLLGIFRMNHAAHPEEPRFDRLIEALGAASPAFVELWQRRHTAPLTGVTAPIFHPEFGDLLVHSMRLPIRQGHCEGATAFLFVPANAETAESFSRMAAKLASSRQTTSA
ncbi:XRE family transcriptional regulator [Frateuria sp. Soil773]|uniref:helix-turn-helix transcriptional regulator n=1 Tax=Frateuria sp. Soil773 TaxID=1736407 RepID=UPI0006F80A4E|nr:helix-turn-helix transcriptional regulator [Frateuria sp. Soil773]KRE97638.1 XRE family transcriptional regulator [Frateuria sp. Soil773]